MEDESVSHRVQSSEVGDGVAVGEDDEDDIPLNLVSWLRTHVSLI